jgi:O-antigen/teichoic acid export membrane protein
VLKPRLLKNSFYTVLALAFIGLVPFVFNIFVARTFGKDILGEINIALSFSLMVTLFVTNFFGSTANKFLAEYRGRKDLEAFQFVFLFSLITPFVFLTCINAIILWKWDFLSHQFSINATLLFPIIAYIYLRSFYIIIRRIFYGVDLVKYYAIIEIFADLVFFISLFIVSKLHLSYYLIHCYLSAYTIFTIIGFFHLFKKYTHITHDLESEQSFHYKTILSKISHYGFLTMIGTSASTGTGYLSMIFTGYYLSSSDAGLYSSVLSIISILMFLPRLTSQVLLPEFSKLYGAGKSTSILQTLKIAFGLLLIIAIAVNGILFIFAENILMLFGPTFSSGSLILRIILPSVFLRMISVPLITFLSGTKYVLHPNIGGVIIFITSVACWFFLVPIYGLLGIALGYSIGIATGLIYLMIMGGFKLRAFHLEYE